jgi:hypothetical protein
MSPSELLTIIRNAKGDVEKLNRIIDVFDLLTDDFGLVHYSHDTYLPAIREYLRGKTTADYRFKEARVRRARLGGSSRWLYYHQRETFERVIQMLCPFPDPQFWIDQLWVGVKNAEIGLLRNARDKA